MTLGYSAVRAPAPLGAAGAPLGEKDGIGRAGAPALGLPGVLFGLRPRLRDEPLVSCAREAFHPSAAIGERWRRGPC